MKQGSRRLPLLVARGLLLAAAAGWLISLTISTGISTVLEDRRPDVAMRYSSSNPNALVNQAGLLLQSGSPEAIARARQLALEALRHSPVISSAYSILGFVEDSEGKAEKAQQLLTMAQSLNRRDFFMHLWFIESLSAKGDVAGTLAHYDTALTTSATATPLLMPVLVQAAKDPAIQAGLVPILARQPVWGNTFIREFTAKSDAPLAVAALFERMRRSGQRISRGRQAEAAERLVREHLFAQAAMVMGRSTSRTLVDDANFAHANAIGPFAWDLTSDYGLGATRDQQSSDGTPPALSFFANRDVGGDAARQLLILPAGRYRLSTTAHFEPASVDGKPAWQVRCADGDGQQIGSLDLPAGPAPSVVATTLTVPAGCTAQWLALHVREPGGLDGVNGRVRQVAIDRLD